ncbi:molybdopterin molybdotransferase MoeA [Effusibacillus dendaii]|uniref:Molybdopterin molybdenumtransferase n=1 Tax=Effusibacillus dendaii TaxID=2743772 RepID=A0A7I8DDZ9_9BACL|nr:gephyrin-like molybdotransferase Glp [Effusibacillus dendaii]BCJ87179.1 molybdopterin molybdenumtransferase [Effusibacillus dendaii]
MMRVGLTMEEAIGEILASVKPLSVFQIPLKDSFQYRLAEDVKANAPMPSFDRSMMDGYAIRSVDVANASPEQPALLRVVGRIAAGEVPERELRTGEAMRIMTGAPIPEGADAVARFEVTDGQQNPEAETVAVYLPVRTGESISLAGEDIRANETILRKGTLIGAAEMALLASVGVAAVPVFRKPVIGILSSGRELVGLEQPLSYGKIYNSNSYMISGLVSAWGGVPHVLPQVDDKMDEVVEAIRAAMPAVDALVTTGGVAGGDFDLMRGAYQLAGGQVRFWKVNIRPGTPFTYGTLQGKPVFGLSGNPAAGFVNALLFLQSALLAMSGQPNPQIPVVEVELAADPQVKPIGMDRFLRTHIRVEAGALKAIPLPFGQSAGIMSSLTGIQGFIRIPAKTEVKPGDLLQAYLLAMPAAGGVIPWQAASLMEGSRK